MAQYTFKSYVSCQDEHYDFRQMNHRKLPSIYTYLTYAYLGGFRYSVDIIYIDIVTVDHTNRGTDRLATLTRTLESGSDHDIQVSNSPFSYRHLRIYSFVTYK